MASPSKEGNILKLILENSPLRQWHFEEIVKNAKVTKAVASKWLRSYVKKRPAEESQGKGKIPLFYSRQQQSCLLFLEKALCAGAALQKRADSGIIVA